MSLALGRMGNGNMLTHMTSKKMVPKMLASVSLGDLTRNSARKNAPVPRKTPKTTVERVSKKAPLNISFLKYASGFAWLAALSHDNPVIV